jgi:hypothetical protein
MESDVPPSLALMPELNLSNGCFPERVTVPRFLKNKKKERELSSLMLSAF